MPNLDEPTGQGTGSAPALVRDPVCGMMVDPQQTPWREQHEGKTYWFCNPRCAGKFRVRPAHYVEALALFWEHPSPGPARARGTTGLRAQAVARLGLVEGSCAFDLRCGAGLSLPLLRVAVGASGEVYASDPSAERLAAARRRIDAAGWANVHLVEADAAGLQLPEPADGLLCFDANDILLSPVALPRALGCLRPGARVAAAGMKLVRGWRGAFENPLICAYAGLSGAGPLAHAPYAELRQRLAGFHVEERGLGSRYLAVGVHQP
jgi:YHS domain-containing protein